MGMYYLRPLVRNQGDDSILRLKYRIVALVTIVLILGLFLTRLPQANAQFIIAGWEPRDENGNGFYLFAAWQNSSGSFINIQNPDTGIDTWYPENTSVAELNYTANTALRFQARVLVNHTRLGFAPAAIDAGRQHILVSLDMSVAGTSVFTISNMTYDSLWGIYETGIWWIVYTDIVDYIIEPATIYVVTFSLEVYII